MKPMKIEIIRWIIKSKKSIPFRVTESNPIVQLYDEHFYKKPYRYFAFDICSPIIEKIIKKPVHDISFLIEYFLL